MRPRLLSRMLFFVTVSTFLGALATDAFPQTEERLVKKLERKFPEGSCPLDTNFLGTFTTETGIVQLIFLTRGDDDGGDLKWQGAAVAFSQVLDDISIIEAAEFAANQVEDPGNCYFDGPPYMPVFTGDLLNNPNVPFYEPFSPPSSECAWVTDGATISAGELHFDGAGASGEIFTASVVISGLTPGTPYVLHGRWFALGFLLPDNCIPPACCLDVKVIDLTNGCGPLPAQESTWGGVKSLYKK